MGLFDRGPSEELSQGAVAHAHKSSGFVHFHRETLETPASLSWILIDLSDTTNWPHTDTDVGHIDLFQASIDPGVNSAWTLNMWVVENVTATNSLRTMIWSKSGNKSTGNSLDVFERYVPHGPVLRASSIASTMSAVTTDYNSSEQLRTVISPDAPAVYPGNGDFIFEIILTGDDIGLHVNLAYHTHNKFHS